MFTSQIQIHNGVIPNMINELQDDLYRAKDNSVAYMLKSLNFKTLEELQDAGLVIVFVGTSTRLSLVVTREGAVIQEFNVATFTDSLLRTNIEFIFHCV